MLLLKQYLFYARISREHIDIDLFRQRADHVVFISTDSVFDPTQRRLPQNEESDHYLSAGYGGCKRQCELTLIQADTGTMAWTILRAISVASMRSSIGALARARVAPASSSANAATAASLRQPAFRLRVVCMRIDGLIGAPEVWRVGMERRG